MNKGADSWWRFSLFLNSDDSYVFDACMNFLSLFNHDEIIFVDIILHDDGCQILSDRDIQRLNGNSITFRFITHHLLFVAIFSLDSEN